MRIIRDDAQGIKEAINALKRGQVIVYPTDTAYALGGIFNSQAVVKKILKIKKRTNSKFTLVASSMSQVENFFKPGRLLKKTAKQFWPGPYSIVVSPIYAVRVPGNKIARRLSRAVGRPLIATSANISSQPALYSAQEVFEEFKRQKNQPDLIIDAGKLPNKKPSTIVMVRNGKIVTLRP